MNWANARYGVRQSLPGRRLTVMRSRGCPSVVTCPDGNSIKPGANGNGSDASACTKPNTPDPWISRGKLERRCGSPCSMLVDRNQVGSLYI
jgi:hypothetical protein